MLSDTESIEHLADYSHRWYEDPPTASSSKKTPYEQVAMCMVSFFLSLPVPVLSLLRFEFESEELIVSYGVYRCESYRIMDTL
jgi:hypothetical protein